MKKIVLIAGLMLGNIGFSAENNDFLFSGEQIRSKIVGNVTVLVLEDFINNSKLSAKIIAIEGEGSSQYALVERNGEIALLLPEILYNHASENIFVSFVDTCQAECSGSAVAGAIGGGIAGASAGAQIGGAVGAGGGPVTAAAGAAGGAVVVGGIGVVGGFIGGYEACKIETDCANTPPPDPEGKGGKEPKLIEEGGDPK